jgi:hypothetical protein
LLKRLLYETQQGWFIDGSSPGPAKSKDDDLEMTDAIVQVIDPFLECVRASHVAGAVIDAICSVLLNTC